jgi:hypothetical protein
LACWFLYQIVCSVNLDIDTFDKNPTIDLRQAAF